MLDKIKEKNTHGFNITIPFKKDIFKYIGAKNIHALNIGAINCVKILKKNRGINTDWIGYLNSIKGYGINKSKNVLVLGYGGASKAIVYGLFYKGFENVLVFNRSKKLVRYKEKKVFTKKYNTLDKYLANVGLIINTTPINPLNKKQISKVSTNVVVSDIVYKPMKKYTVFLCWLSKQYPVFIIGLALSLKLTKKKKKN